MDLRRNINERWCTDVTVLKKMCCSDLERLFINSRIFYLLREFCSFILVNIYIPPQAHMSSALQNFHHQLRKFNLPQDPLKQFYSAFIESVLCTSITVWFGSAIKSGIRRLQRTVRTSEHFISAPLPTLQELYTSRVRKGAQKIPLDPSHSSHPLF